jgi:hypothetical protein
MKKYKVFYTLKTVAVVEGESFVLPSFKEVFETDSDDINYAFLDIVDRHRGDSVVGFEINEIKEVEEEVLQTFGVAV